MKKNLRIMSQEIGIIKMNLFALNSINKSFLERINKQKEEKTETKINCNALKKQ